VTLRHSLRSGGDAPAALAPAGADFAPLLPEPEIPFCLRSRPKLVNGVDACKYGKQWVVTTAAMQREYGQPKTERPSPERMESTPEQECSRQ
ncbi:MAG: hypothetical protein MJ202_09930, partial [Lentisphaeria bacterium]|nr:hypothetical protein [Lentisphaeria bacterium]